MTEQERIKQMVEDGKISQAEAELLLETLDEVDQAEAEVDARLSSAESAQATDAGQPTGAEPTAARAPADDALDERRPPAPPPPAPPNAIGGQEADVARGLHWVRVEMMAGDLEIRVDESLSEPRIEGKAEVSRTGQDFTIKQERRKNLLGGLLSMGEDLHIRVPGGYGVDLQLMAGDVDIRGVPYLKGNLLAGDINAHDIGGVDLTMKSGDLDIGLRLTEGRHRIEALAGDIDVQILPGSSLTVQGDLLAGEVQGPFDIERRLVGGRIKGVVGGGAASLDIHMKAGNLELGVKGE